MNELGIYDKNDTTGMFSKAGRVTVEIYNILNHGQEILKGNRRYYKPPESMFKDPIVLPFYP